CEKLHAKCYLNEERALITSMNFYEFSQVNNDEMGIVVIKDKDPQLYEDINKEIQRLIRNNDEIKVTVEKVIPNKNNNSSTKGHCIRCKTEIKLNPKVPLCNKCYKSWSKYSDKTYKEKCCHICNKEFNSSMEKPVCLNCYNKNKSLFTKK
ncbi:hypothetical protein HN865_01860, partial [Candidatus Woesearchaeota archaeon]|nr:hypothetical protein [Candidatus Woesearchaeota archaeon]